jgi:hypothetical protein
LSNSFATPLKFLISKSGIGSLVSPIDGSNKKYSSLSKNYSRLDLTKIASSAAWLDSLCRTGRCLLLRLPISPLISASILSLATTTLFICSAQEL